LHDTVLTKQTADTEVNLVIEEINTKLPQYVLSLHVKDLDLEQK